MSLKGCEKAIALTGEQCCLHNRTTASQYLRRNDQQGLNRWNGLDLSSDLCQSCIEQSKDFFDEITVVRSEEESAQVSAAEGGAASTASSALFHFD